MGVEILRAQAKLLDHPYMRGGLQKNLLPYELRSLIELDRKTKLDENIDDNEDSHKIIGRNTIYLICRYNKPFTENGKFIIMLCNIFS